MCIVTNLYSDMTSQIRNLDVDPLHIAGFLRQIWDLARNAPVSCSERALHDSCMEAVGSIRNLIRLLRRM
jgi:hypothetical protein